MSDDVKRSDAEWFEGGPEKDYKIDRSQVLQLQGGDILIVHMPGDSPPELYRKLQQTICDAIREIAPNLNIKVFVTDSQISFSVLRTKLEKENALKPQPTALKPQPQAPGPKVSF